MQPNTDPTYLASQGFNSTLPERFITKLAVCDNGCLVWSASKTKTGYGKINKGMPPLHAYERAYRVAWILFVSPIPKGMQVLHNCPGKHNPSCCNPAHLKLGTISQNMRDRNLNGTQQFAKLTPSEVTEIRRLSPRGYKAKKELASRFGVSVSNIYLILQGKTWV